MNVFMDDMRDAPQQESWVLGPQIKWTVIRTVHETWSLLQAGCVEHLSLDHDMGLGPTGYDLLCWMEERDVWPKHMPSVHSANFAGAKRMWQVIDKKYRGK